MLAAVDLVATEASCADISISLSVIQKIHQFRNSSHILEKTLQYRRDHSRDLVKYYEENDDVLEKKPLGKSHLERNKLHRVIGMQITEAIRRPR